MKTTKMQKATTETRTNQKQIQQKNSFLVMAQNELKTTTNAR